MTSNARNDALSVFDFIAEQTHDVIVQLNLQGTLTYVSPSIGALGYAPESLIGTSGLDLFHPEDQPKIVATTLALISGQPFPTENFERRVRSADGRWVWVEGSPGLRRDSSGQPVEIVSVFRDISARRAAHDALLEQSQLVEAAFEHSAIAKCLIDLEGRVLKINAAHRELSGFTEAELIAMGPSAFDYVEDYAPIATLHTPRLLAGEIGSFSHVSRCRRADGAGQWVEFNVSLVRDPDNLPKYFVAEIRDLTEERAAKVALEESERRFRLIAENTSDVIVVSDLEGRFTYLSPSVRWLGYEPEQLLGLSTDNHTHPDDLEALMRAFARLLSPRNRGSKASERIRWRGRHGVTGEWHWIESSPGLIRDPVTGEPVSFIDTLRDISEQVRQEEALVSAEAEAAAAAGALRESERRYRMIAENINDVVIHSDRHDVLVYASPSVRQYGYEPDDLVGIHVDAFLHPSDLADVLNNRSQVDAGQNPSALEEKPHRYRLANGDWVWLQGSPRVLFGEDGENLGTLNVLRNVTESRAQSELFEAAFTHAPVAMALTGLDGKFIRVNAASKRLLGYPEGAPPVLVSTELGHPDEVGADDARNDQLVNGEIDQYQAERRFRRADGSFIWVHISISLVRNADGTPKYFVSHSQDLSARKAAEAALQDSEARYRMIAETTSDIIAVSDRDGRITYLSPSMRQLGFEPQELLGKTFTDYTHPDDFPRIRDTLRRQSPGQLAERMRWRARHKVTGDWVWLESMPIRLWDPETGEPTGYLDVMRDVSVQVRQEEALADARAEAEAAAAVKSQFLANMSHEIRTPLTAVLGYSDILSRTPGLDARTQRTVQRIAGAGSALLAIVNDILDFSKLEAGQVEIRPQATDIGEVVAETLALFEEPASTKGLALLAELAPTLPEIVMLDADRLRQILLNLLGNAVKFTNAGQVVARVAPGPDHRSLRFSVEDTGPGMEPEQIECLFQRFNQVDGSTSRRHGGTGLGLAISKGLAEAMGGQISVESKPTQGTAFYVDLPLVAAELTVPEVTRVDVAAVSGARILVVDDNATNRELARRILEAFEGTVAEVDGGAAALEILARDAFDVVLLDLRMPDIDGHEVLNRLRERSGPNRDVPVLAFTADAMIGDSAALERFDGVVLKPIDAKLLAGTVAAAIANKPVATDPNATVMMAGEV